MREKRYRRHNRKKHRYKTLERLYRLYTAHDNGMYMRQIDVFRRWLREDRK